MSNPETFRKGIVLSPPDFDGVDWIAKAAENNLNTIGIHSGGGAAHDVLGRLGEFGTERFRERCRAARIDWEYELHVPHQLMDYSLFAAHPEYFAQMRRTRQRVDTANWCVSAPVVLPMVAANAATLTARLPSSTHRYFYWATDAGCDDWCHCDLCAPWSAAEQNLLTANAIARRLREDDPEAEAACLFYLSTLAAPRRVKPEANVFAEFAPMNRCYEHGICDENCAVNREHLARLTELIQVFTPEKIHILEYWIDSSYLGYKKTGSHHRVPCVRGEIMRRDIAFYASLGIRSITSFAVMLDADYFRLYGDGDFMAYIEAMAELK